MGRAKIHDNAIDLLARVFNSHKKGLPEWLKNAREAYLRAGIADRDRRLVVVNCRRAGGKTQYIECIDFVGISGRDIESRYLEWANPDAVALGPKDREGGQGNGGKAYLRQLFEQGWFISICDRKLSIVSFVDKEKYELNFIPDPSAGKDRLDDNPSLPGIRQYARDWLEAYGFAADHNITIVRGQTPLKPIESDSLLRDIQQFPQARESIRSCRVLYHENGQFLRELGIREPSPHPSFQRPIKIAIPTTLRIDGRSVLTARSPEYPQGELELRVSAQPLQGQHLGSWNRIDFLAGGLTVVGYKQIDELQVESPQYARNVFGTCNVPLLTDPKDKYESQGRGALVDGPLSRALYGFIVEEINKILQSLAKQQQSSGAIRRRKNLEKLNEKLARWIDAKLPDLAGLQVRGEKEGEGKPARKTHLWQHRAHAAKIRIHRTPLNICRTVSYVLRVIAEDAQGFPAHPGKLTWRSHNPDIATVHPTTGVVEAKAQGLATISVANDESLTAEPILVHVHEAVEVSIKTHSPARVGVNRRLPVSVLVRTPGGRTLKDPIVSWRSSDSRVVTVSQDGTLIGGEMGDAEVVAFAGTLESMPLDVLVEKGTAGAPKGGANGKPRILLSGQDPCPFDRTPVLLDPTDPLVFQRGYKPDYDNNVFWINLQHPLPDALLRGGEHTVQWRTYHFQRVVDVYTMLMLRAEHGDDKDLDVDGVLQEVHEKMTEIYRLAKEEIFGVLFDESIDFDAL